MRYKRRRVVGKLTVGSSSDDALKCFKIEETDVPFSIPRLGIYELPNSRVRFR